MISRILLIFIALLFCSNSFAGEKGTQTFPNTYNLQTGIGSFNSDTTGKLKIVPTIGGTTGVFIAVGQSLISNISANGATPYTPTNTTTCFNFNPYDGFIYRLSDPVVGPAGSPYIAEWGVSWLGRLCDNLRATTAKYDQVLIIPVAAGSASVASFDTGGANKNRIDAAISWALAKGYTVNAVLWFQGTTDCDNGTSQAAYTASLRSIISNAVARGFNRPWMIARSSIRNGVTCSTIRNAQAAVAADAGNLLGPDADAVNPADYDGVHYFNAGNIWIAGQWNTSIRALLP